MDGLKWNYGPISYPRRPRTFDVYVPVKGVLDDNRGSCYIIRVPPSIEVRNERTYLSCRVVSYLVVGW